MVSDRITFGGLASGLDTNLIIDQLIAIQQRPILQAESRRFVMEQKRGALGEVNTSLLQLLNSAGSLNDRKVVGARGTSVTADADDAKAVIAAAGSSAAIGSFTIEVASLAKPTAVSSGTALGQPVASAVPLDEAGFALPIVAGTFTINNTSFTIPAATASTSVSAASVGNVDPSAILSSAGFTLAPAGTGEFVVNGISITFDASTDSLNTLIGRINGSEAGVTASFDAATDMLTLTANDEGAPLITYSDTTGNFMEVVNFIDGVGTPIATDTAGTDLISLDDVITMVNGAGIGVTASIVSGNLLELDGGVSNVTVGAGGDTSNFLTATRLIESPPGTTRTSTRNIGVVSLTDIMDNGRFATAVTTGAGSFKINGIEINYDATVDSLSNVIERINQSSAGVTALYDSQSDKLVLTQERTGSAAISLESVTGNFLLATGLFGAAQTLGSNASYKINGGALQYASSNTVSDAVTGLTLTLRATTAAPVDVEVFADTSAVAGRIDGFVKDYNALMARVERYTAFNEDGDNGLLFGDQTLRFLDRNLRQRITGTALGITNTLNSLSSIGLTFGAVGSEVGSTDTLVFDRGVFDAAVQSDPEGVRQLLTAFEATAALDGGGSGSIASIAGKPTTAKNSGNYTINSTVSGDLTVTFTPDDGGASVVSTGFISAGGTNSTLIPGVTLTAAGVLVAGVDTITVTAQREGVAKALNEVIESFTRTGGIMDGREEDFTTRIKDVNEQIERMERRVEARRAQLIRKFTVLETTISQLQSQQSALSGMLGQLGVRQS